jgi:hypothetical protein
MILAAFLILFKDHYLPAVTTKTHIIQKIPSLILRCQILARRAIKVSHLLELENQWAPGFPLSLLCLSILNLPCTVDRASHSLTMIRCTV